MPRILDLILLTVLLPVIFLLVTMLAIVVRYDVGSPIFFTQMRGGYKGKLFAIRKFRTMTNALSEDGNLLSDENRLTKIGKFLRATSLDEIPSLWNLAKGDLRLVGPRPLLPEYLELYTPEQMRRHNAVPGITGWAQIMGRNNISWEQKFAHDLWYIDHRSFWLDLRILVVTAWRVITRRDINAQGDATMPRFTGSREKI